MAKNKHPTTCPACKCEEIAFIRKTDEWLCTNTKCNHRWRLNKTGYSIAKEDDTEKERVKLFLSYGRRDAKQLADRLSVDLTAAGFEVWQDTLEITTGTSWQHEIVDGLRTAQVVIGLLSPQSVRSGPTSVDGVDSVCLGEIAYALFNPPPTPVVPVLTQRCEAPLCIYHLDYTDMTAWQDSNDQYQAGLKRLLDGIEAALKGERRYRKWYHQLNPWDFAPFLYEKRHGFVGREWLFDEIDAWRAGNQESSLLITGDPGTGKSALVAELVHRNPRGQIIAYHCCQADTKETLQPWRFVRSIAAMIASKLPEYAAQLERPDIQKALSTASCQNDAGSSLERGILTPLHTLPAPDEGVRYILVDALDEALTLDDGSNTIVRLLSTRLPRLPLWLRIVATTRNEPAVLDRLRSLRAKELDAEDPRNLDDIDHFIKARLESPNLAALLSQSGASSLSVADSLRVKSEGNFLYVRQVLDAIEREQYSFDRLNELPLSLGSLYFVFFERNFPDEASFQAVRHLLETVVAAAEPLAREQLAVATDLEPRRELIGVLRKLSVYVPAKIDADGVEQYAVYHKSLADWLSNPNRAGGLYSIDPLNGHRQLCEAGMREFDKSASSMSPYYIAHLPSHLMIAEQWNNLEAVLTDLKYIQAKCVAGMTFDLVRDYKAALGALPELEAERQEEEQQRNKLRTYCDKLIKYARERVEVIPLPQPPDTGPVIARFRQSQDESERRDLDLETRARRLRAFANFVSTHSHLLSQSPSETIIIASNFARDGIIFERSEPLVDALSRPWFAREPRPPATSAWPLCQQTLQGHARSVISVAITPDGQRAVSGSDDNTLKVWDLKSGGEEITLHGHTHAVTSVAITPDGRRVVSASSDRTLKLWGLQSGVEENTLHGHASEVSSVAVTPDGRRAVSASHDTTLKVWDLQSGVEEITLHGHTAGVWSVAITPDGRRAVSASSDKTLKVWNLQSGDEEKTLRGHTSIVISVAMTPDGRFAVSVGRDLALKVWDLQSGIEKFTLHGHTAGVKSVTITPDGRRVVSAGHDDTLKVWDLHSGVEEKTLSGHTSCINSVAITPDGRRAVSASRDLTLKVWDLQRGIEENTLLGHTAPVWSVAITPEGRRVVSASHDHTLKVWKLQSGVEEATLQGHTSTVCSVAITPDGRSAVSGSIDRTLKVWDLESGAEENTLHGNTSMTSVAITPDGRRAVSTSIDRTLKVWDIESGVEEMSLLGHTSSVRDVAITPDGRHSASASEDQTLKVWDLQSGVEETTLQGHTGAVWSVAITPDGRRAISASQDKTVKLWNLRSGACIASYPAGASVHSVAVHGPDRIVCSTADGQVHFLTLRNAD